VKQEITISDEAAGLRLDTALAQLTKQSRSWWQQQIRAQYVHINGRPATAKQLVEAGDAVAFEPVESQMAQAEAISLPIVYEDASILVIDKPAGVLTHPVGSEGLAGTVAGFAKQHTSDPDPTRPGIVHRLDRDTSGLLLIAKNIAAKEDLQKQFKQRSIQKTYLALVRGRLKHDEATIRLPINRSRDDSAKRKVEPTGQEAETSYRVVGEYGRATLVEVLPKTGRTHQIRVHFAHLGHPIVGDSLYGEPSKQLSRQFLHASSLSFTDMNGKPHIVHSDLPEELKNYLELLRNSV
jgi:23S rRNA pseudouridine1911/1915/1917 synthase